ncbi:MAG TPA: hypothetical protein VK973_01660, partial [Arenicellales bacterium]|nr:hypothetical protein [Arenicellales bacterium]
MKAAWYERQGPAREVLQVGELPDPEPGPGELRIRICVSGVTVDDVTRRRADSGFAMSASRVIPHGDGAGEVDRVGEGVSGDWVGERVWCFGADRRDGGGTAAEYAVVPARQAVLLPAGITMDQGACLGTAGIMGHRAVNVAGPVSGRTVLVRGAATSFGLSAVHMAHRAGARVVAEVDSEAQESLAREAGANE